MQDSEQFERRCIAFFDAEFYLSTYDDVARSGVAPLEHFLKLGCREGRRPNRWYSDRLVPRSLRNKNPGTPPVILFLTHLPGLDEARFEQHCQSQKYSDFGHEDCWACNQMRGNFDGAWYRGRYPDVPRDVDALAHYCETGWRERRHPSASFNAEYYLESNLDVASAQLNPFVHFLSSGKEEGRKAMPHDAVERRHLIELKTFDEAARELDGIGLHLKPVSPVKLAAEMLQLATGTNGICLSLSHDEYLKHTGGIQKFIGDESRCAKEDGYLYVHLCPAVPDLRLVEAGSTASLLLNCTIANQFVGTFTAAEMIETLEAVGSKQVGLLRIITLHSAMGWRMDAVIGLATLPFMHKFFYVHDYFSLCGEYRLLRNNIQSCNAPPPNSAACSICVHGQTRMQHLARFNEYFARVKPTLLFPSDAASRQFAKGRPDCSLRSMVVPHLTVTRVKDKRPREARPRDTIRVAYCGAIAAHKGFHHFQQLAHECISLSHLEFFHFGVHDGKIPNVEYRKVGLKNGRSVLAEQLRAHEIDAVFVGSTWAETFNFVAYEAVEAGAAVITLEGSGNVAAFVDQFGVGCQLPDWRAVVKLLQSKSLGRELDQWQANAAALRFAPNRSFLTKGVLDEKQALFLHLV